MDKEFILPDSGVIFGHQPCQTKDAKWLCLENVYEHCYRPHMYDIGGTYIEDLPHYWFYYKIEIVGKLFLLHIFVSSRSEGTFNVSISCNSEIVFKRKQRVAYLTSSLKTHKFEKASEMSQNYLITYSFSDLDIEIMKGMKLYIPISFDNFSSGNGIREADRDHDLRALLHDPFGADFVIESAEGEKFKVHKTFLSAHSEVFKAMLKENTAESQNSYMKMVDVNKDDLKFIIEYIYTGTIEDLEGSNFFNLLMLADRYNLQGLRELSECALASQITLDNVIETLAVADLYNAENLKIAALKYIKCNNVAIHNIMFEELNSAELIREICQFLVPS
ncbi:BTB/POZ domain-containing protein 8-like [Maniola jurtina]|uniref:BTB/POZ domain-containing protein 8-like n=1 Tax=Maniola jurtina TaxID=191418 RepID=UPI001E68CB2D|nr:BTB/POZ domain-containing protein 8-like [Maniola jurtina]